MYEDRLIRVDAALDFDDPPETRFTFWNRIHGYDVVIAAGHQEIPTAYRR